MPEAKAASKQNEELAEAPGAGTNTGSDLVTQENAEESSNRVLVYSRAEGHIYPVKSSRSDAHQRSMQNIYTKGGHAPTVAPGSTVNAVSQEARQGFSSLHGDHVDEASSTAPAGSSTVLQVRSLPNE